MNAPVVLFVYNRLDHTKNVIESLAKNVLAENTDLYIFSDAAKTENGIEKVNEVRKYIQSTDWRDSFQKVAIVEAEKNKGLAKSIIGGVTSVLEEYGKVIVIEDDLVLSPYFLKYMNGALDYYENIPEIWSVSGYSFPMKSLADYPHDVFYSYRGSSWGWATWLDRWKKTDWEVKDFKKLMQDKTWQKKFNRGGDDLTQMLKAQMEGKINSWAIRWVFSQSNLDMYTVYPKKSYVLNDGCDGSGTHVGATDEYQTDIQKDMQICRFEELQIEESIAKEFWYKYSDTLDKKIKRNLKKYKSLISYGIFGGLTTLVNIVTYNLCYYGVGISNTFSNVFAWILSVAFAYLTNKLWVFESKSWKWEVLRREVFAFVSCRLATGIMDLGIMYICVDVLNWHAMFMKICSNVLVIILNYIFSKLVIFKKK